MTNTPKSDRRHRIVLESRESASMEQDGLVASFNAGVLHVTRGGDGQEIFTAPAVLWHRINGRLTNKDIAQTICDNKYNPIGIYMGTWIPEWAKGRKIRTYAAMTDARLSQSFNGHVNYLIDHPNGEKLLDRPTHAVHVTYEMAMRTRILGLKPRERTGQMIPSSALLNGEKYPGSITRRHNNNMYDLRHTGDFAKVNNGGFDSRFVTTTGAGEANWYITATEDLSDPAYVFVTDLSGGIHSAARKTGRSGSLRPFIAEMC